jgi:rubrerythrin
MADLKADIRKEKAAIKAENKRLNPSSKNFSKRKEDFACEKCGSTVKGSGYTNHCPICVYSKHVDIKPGDRLATCGGLMKPVRVEGTEKEYRVLHRCTVCKYEKVNKTAPQDSIEALVAIIKENSSSYSKGK